MSTIGSVTFWVSRLKAGEAAAAGPLWEGYYRRLVGLARVRLRDAPRGAADEEDVALSAFDSFCRAAAAGRFPHLDDRDDLWRVLLVLTARKATDYAERERTVKRGGGRVRPTSELEAEGGGRPLEAVARDPDPAEAALVAEECRRLLGLLGSDELRSVAVWKLEGFSNAEIAAKLGVVEGTVERKLQRIRQTWKKGAPV